MNKEKKTVNSMNDEPITEEEFKRLKRKLDKTLKKSLPKNKKQWNLFIIFCLVTTISLAGVFLFAFLACGACRDIGLAISSGLFGSGVYATLTELLNIRNNKAKKYELLLGLKFFCINFITFMGYGTGKNEETHNYHEWATIVIDEYLVNGTVPNDLYERLYDIERQCIKFSGKSFHEYDNPYITNNTISTINLLNAWCRRAENALKERGTIKVILEQYLIKVLPRLILGIFPELSDEFDKERSFKDLDSFDEIE